MLIIITEQIILVIRKYRCNRIHFINPVVLTKNTVAVQVIIKIHKLDFTVPVNSNRDGRNNRINIFVWTLYSIKSNDILLYRFSSSTPGKFCYFIYKLCGFTFGNKRSSLYGIHQNMDFCHTELAFLNVILICNASNAVDFITIFIQRFDIRIEGTSITFNANGFKPFQKFSGTERMILIRLLTQNFPKL